MQVFYLPPTTQDTTQEFYCPFCRHVIEIDTYLDSAADIYRMISKCPRCGWIENVPLLSDEETREAIDRLDDTIQEPFCPVCGAYTVADNHWEHGYVGASGSEGPDYWQFQSCTRCDWSDEYKHHENEELPF